jgi:LmbE family N-acetylglucosaminyl deacetylase
MAKVLEKVMKRLERTINTRQAYKFFMRDWQALTDLQNCSRVVSSLRFRQTLEPLEMIAPRGKRITVVAPHPDDEMLGAGGTLIHALARGASVRCIYLTSGRPAEQVEAETAQVAAHIGYRTEFLRYPVDRIPVTHESVARLGASLASSPVDCLFIPILLDDHDDHRRANQLFWHAWRGGLIRKDVEVWCYQVYSPIISNVVVAIDEVADAKAAAVRMWQSQMKIRRFDHYILGLNAFNLRLLPRAKYVEAFFVVPVREYADLCAIYFENPSTAFYNPAYKSAAMSDIADTRAGAQ